jgi:hypothetical protein
MRVAVSGRETIETSPPTVLFNPCKPGDPNPLYEGRWYDIAADGRFLMPCHGPPGPIDYGDGRVGDPDADRNEMMAAERWAAVERPYRAAGARPADERQAFRIWEATRSTSRRTDAFSYCVSPPDQLRCDP